MIKQIVHILLKKRHYWRFVGFDELSELYTSTMLRSMGLSLIGIFIPYYLYTLGVSIRDILFFLAGVYSVRMLFDVLSGYLVARIGPKHTILASNLFQIGALGLLLTYESYHWPLWMIAILNGISLSMFFVAYHVDFSKVIHAEHGGKELGFMTIMERIGAAMGPVIGGVVATLFGPQYTIAAALLLFVGAVIPLFFSAEPTRTHQKLVFRGFPYRKLKRDFLTRAAMGMDNTASLILWPFYAAMVLLTVNTYASVGLVTSLGIIASILTAHFIGQVVDRNKGRLLLSWAVVVNSIVHVLRTLVSGFGGTIMVNMANEAVTAGYMMPYTKGMYARAEDLPGFRIVYIIMVEVAVDVGKVLLLLVAWGLTFVIHPLHAILASFLIAAVFTLLIMTQNFPALRRARG
jgi:MFS family permease